MCFIVYVHYYQQSSKINIYNCIIINCNHCYDYFVTIIKLVSIQIPACDMYVVCSKSIANFEFLRVYVYSIFDFLWRYVGTHIPHLCWHFECSVNFWQLYYLYVFWLVFDFCLFSFGNKKKSQGARSGEYGDCSNIIVFLAKNLLINNDVWAGALSWCKGQFVFFHKSGRFWRIASRKLRITCR